MQYKKWQAASLILLLGQQACSHSKTVVLDAKDLAARSDVDSLELKDENGHTLPLGPRANVSVTRKDGTTIDVRAESLCTSPTGLVRREKSGDCAHGSAFARWDEISTVHVEEFDGAATVGVTACAVIIVAGVIAYAAASKNASKAEPPSSRTAASPKTDVRTPATPSVNGGGKPVTSRTPPPAGGGGASSLPHPSVGDSRGPVVAGGHSSTVVVVGPSVYFGGPVNLGHSPYSSLSDSPTDPPVATVVPPAWQPFDTADAKPLYSDDARRKAHVLGTARLEGGMCVPGSTDKGCVVGGLRVGARFENFVELSLGVRAESNRDGQRTFGTAGVALHGDVVTARWIALALGVNVSTDGAVNRVAPFLALRLRPTQGLWIGIAPLVPTYLSEKRAWNLLPTLDVAVEF